MLGLQRLLEIDDIALCRTDLAGLGAAVAGAAFAGIGLSSSLRHLGVPRRPRIHGDAGASRRTQPSDHGLHVLVPGCLAWIHGDRLWRAGLQADLTCHCPAHPDGRELREYRDHCYREEAALHAFYTWRGVVERLEAVTTSERLLEWGTICREAVEHIDRLETETGVSFSSKPLRWWTSL